MRVRGGGLGAAAAVPLLQPKRIIDLAGLAGPGLLQVTQLCECANFCAP